MSAFKIYQQIPLVMSEIEAVSKTRNNSQQGFKFRGIDDVINEVSTRLSKHHLFIVPEVLEERREERETKNGGVVTYVILKIKYTIFADDGSNVSAVMIGEGMDSGDKASNKAQSVALKYFLLQIFAIPTEDAKDPDAESHEVKPKSKPVVKVNPLKKVEAPGAYVCTFGKFKDMRIDQIDQFELESYCEHIMNTAVRDGKTIQGQVRNFLDTAEAFLQTKDVRTRA